MRARKTRGLAHSARRSSLGLRACDAPASVKVLLSSHPASPGCSLMKRPDKKYWTVYIVRCANGSLYTGITNDLAGRIADHNAGRGAKYTAAFGPVALAWRRRKKDRSAASKLEAAIKKLTRPEKEALISRPAARFSKL